MRALSELEKVVNSSGAAIALALAAGVSVIYLAIASPVFADPCEDCPKTPAFELYNKPHKAEKRATSETKGIEHKAYEKKGMEQRAEKKEQKPKYSAKKVEAQDAKPEKPQAMYVYRPKKEPLKTTSDLTETLTETTQVVGENYGKPRTDYLSRNHFKLCGVGRH